MDGFKNIAVAASVGALDLRTLENSVAIAGREGAKLSLVDVFEPLPSWRRTVTVEGGVVEVQKLMLEDRRERLSELLSAAGGSDDAAVITMLGKPFIEIIHFVGANDCDLVIVGDTESTTHQKRGVPADVMQLLRKCPVPVWVMRPCENYRPRVLALIDPGDADPVRSGLNDLVIDAAMSVALTEGADVHIATAWDLPGEALLRSSAFVSVPAAELDVMLRSSQEEHESRLSTFVRRHRVPGVETYEHLIYGEANEVLPNLASELAVSLIVMGTVARTGLRGFIMGNTAETILRSVDCSVLALKPHGFASPVRPHEGYDSFVND